MTQVFAHRGDHAQERENTVAAFRAARALGVDGVELDVRRSADGQLVVHHDPLVEGRFIAKSAARDLVSYVPTLADAFEVLRGTWVNVEIKNDKDAPDEDYDESGTIVREVLDYLYDADLMSSVIVSCFDLATCAQARDYDVDVRVAWLLWNSPLDAALTRAHVLGFDAVNPHFSLVSEATMQRAHELDLDVNAWTVNDEGDLRAMIDLGVSSVITDRPAFAMELISALA